MDDKSLIYTLVGMKLAEFLDEDGDKQAIHSTPTKKLFDGWEVHYAENEKDCPYCNGEKNE